MFVCVSDFVCLCACAFVWSFACMQFFVCVLRVCACVFAWGVYVCVFLSPCVCVFVCASACVCA